MLVPSQASDALLPGGLLAVPGAWDTAAKELGYPWWQPDRAGGSASPGSIVLEADRGGLGWGQGSLAPGGLVRADREDLYVIASTDASVLDLGKQLQARGARTLTMAPGEGLAALVRHLEEARSAGGWQRLHLLSHGSDGALQIGEQVLTSRNLWRYREPLRQLGSLFSGDGDLLLYGCDLAASAAGQRLVTRLAELTGTDVAASDDASGSAVLGRGDWQLEYTQGSVDLEGVDALTGLTWDGQLGSSASASYGNGILSITNATGSLQISGSTDATSGDLDVTITGLDSTWSQSVSDLTGISISGDEYTINGIDLDSTNSPYTIALYGNVTISGDVYTYGGAFSITSQARAEIRQQQSISIGSSNGVTISTSSFGGSSTGTGTQSYGDITISSAARAVDVGVSIWLPVAKSTISIGSQGDGPTQLIGGSVSISSQAINEPWVDMEIFPLFEGHAGDIAGGVFSAAAAGKVNDLLKGLEDVFIPFDVAISTAKDQITIANAQIKSHGANNNLTISSESKSIQIGTVTTINGANLLGAVTPNWLPNLAVSVGLSKATSQIEISDSSSLSADGDVELTSSTSNDLNSHSEVSKYVMMTDGEGGPGWAPSADRPGEAMAYGQTTTTAEVCLDPESSISGGGAVTITADAKPSTTAATVSKTYRDGHITTGVALAFDETTAQIVIDGTITQGQTSPNQATINQAAINQPATDSDTGTALTSTTSTASSSAVLVGDASGTTPQNGVTVANGQAFAVGDRVTFQQLQSPADLIATIDDKGQISIQDASGTVLAKDSQGSFTVQPGDLLAWTDGTALEFRGSTSQTITLDQFDVADANWQPLTLAQQGAVYVVTAVNGDGALPTDGTATLTLADATPIPINAGPSTGQNHALYRLQSTPISTSSQGVDLTNDELLLGDDPSRWPVAGQLVAYYPLAQGGDDDTSSAIGGLISGQEYFVIPRGAGRIALALTSQDALAGVAVDLLSTGSGPEHLLVFEQGQNPQLTVTLQALGSGDPVGSLATQAQQELITFSGGGSSGDTLTLTLLNLAPHADTAFVSLTISDTDVGNASSLRDQFLSAINATAGITQGEGAEVGSVAFLTAVASGDSGILLTALTPGIGYGALLTTTNSSNLPIANEVATLSETAANEEGVNGLNWLVVPASGGAAPNHGQMLQWSSGLLQQSDGTLVGADGFLDANGNLWGADGQAASQLILSNGSIVYQEQTSTTGSVVGSYLRYIGADAQLDATDLATSLTDDSQWLTGAGPMMEVFNPSQSSQSFRLLSSSTAPLELPGATLSSLSAAAAVLSVDAPWTSFDPAQAINPTNSSLNLPGLNAETGEMVSYYLDPTPFTSNRPLVKQVNASDVVIGSNQWNNIELGPAILQGAPIVNGAPLVQARFGSGFATLVQDAQTGTASSLPQVSQGQTLYLQPSSDGTGVLVYLDDAAQQPLIFSSIGTNTSEDYLLLTLNNWQQQNLPVYGLNNRDQLQLISLGNDNYQLAHPGIDFARA
ncbi:MAG: DUF4347 domain-containing protein, partial [Cyanobium sp.]